MIIETSPEKWKKSLKDFIESSGRSPFVKVRDEDEIDDHLALVHESARAGALLSPEGRIQGLHRHPEVESGVGTKILLNCISKGGSMVVCRENVEGFYKKHGFGAVSRVPFEHYGSGKSWDTDRWGKPDMVFMLFDYDSEEAEMFESKPQARARMYEENLRELNNRINE